MKVVLPTPPQNYTATFITQAFDAIRRALLPAVSKDEATPRILLTGTDGQIYALTITVTSGTPSVTLTQNSGKSHL